MAAFNDDNKKVNGPKKGECFFSVRKLSKRFKLSPNGGHKVIKRLTLKYKLIEIITTEACSICKLLDYEEVTGRNDKNNSLVDTRLTLSGTESQLSANTITITTEEKSSHNLKLTGTTLQEKTGEIKQNTLNAQETKSLIEDSFKEPLLKVPEKGFSPRNRSLQLNQLVYISKEKSVVMRWDSYEEEFLEVIKPFAWDHILKSCSDYIDWLAKREGYREFYFDKFKEKILPTLAPTNTNPKLINEKRKKAQYEKARREIESRMLTGGVTVSSTFSSDNSEIAKQKKVIELIRDGSEVAIQEAVQITNSLVIPAIKRFCENKIHELTTSV